MADIVEFPRSMSAISGERLRATRAAIALRATAVKATSEQRGKAIRAAIAELDRGGSVGRAIQMGYDELRSK